MNWYKAILLTVYVLSSLAMVARIGKPRQPLEPGGAACGLVVAACMCMLVVLA